MRLAQVEALSKSREAFRRQAAGRPGPAALSIDWPWDNETPLVFEEVDMSQIRSWLIRWRVRSSRCFACRSILRR
jgi:hypothetical protein